MLECGTCGELLDGDSPLARQGALDARVTRVCPLCGGELREPPCAAQTATQDA